MIGRRIAFNSLLLAVVGAGCAANRPTKDWQAEARLLQSERDELLRQNQALQGQLADSQRQRETLRTQMEQVESRIQDLSGRLSQGLQDQGVTVEQNGNETVLRAPADVFFSSGSSAIRTNARPALDEIVGFVQTNHPQGRIRVEGHADTDPVSRTRNVNHCNWDLSFKRAHEVMHYLAEQGGIAQDRFELASWGEFLPRDAGDKSKNRRVEIVLVAPVAQTGATSGE